MVRISMSERFAQKFADQVGILQDSGLLEDPADDAGGVPSPLARAARNDVFTAALGNLLANHFNGFLVPITDTNSMDSWIDAGHKAVMVPFQSFAPFRKEDLRVGDIILFDRALDNAQNVLHRIISVQPDGKMMVTRGDNTTILGCQTVQDNIGYVCVGVIY